MNRGHVIRAAFFAALAVGQRPSRRNVEGMIRRITGGEGFSSAEVSAWLKAHASRYLPEPLSTLKPSVTQNQNGSTEPFQNHSRTALRTTPQAQTTLVSEPLCADDENRPRAHANKVLVKSKDMGANAPDARARVGEQAWIEHEDDRERVRLSCSVTLIGTEPETLAATRLEAVLSRMKGLLAEVGLERWRYGLDVANSAGKNWDYAAATMRRNTVVPKPGANGTVVPIRGNGRRVGYAEKGITEEQRASNARHGRLFDDTG
jgi:hypothetical protein